MIEREQPVLPRTESFLDCAGKMRKFKFTQGPQTEGVLLTAKEIAPPAAPGYEFSAWSASLGDALGQLRAKIRAGLARRYLAPHPKRALQLLSCDLAGLINSGGIVIDGRHVPFALILDQLQTLEGSWIDIRLTDPSD